MARGWESKSVESQREDADARRDGGSRLSPVELQADAKRKSLELSRRRVVHDLEEARSEVHKQALENALHFLDDELSRLGR
jgi:hypothetical protein